MSPTTVYTNSFSTPAINNVGQVIFSAAITGFGNQVLYAGSPASLQPVAKTGDEAPGLPAGVRYILFHQYDAPPGLFDASVINDSGQVAFYARFSGPSATNEAVFSGTMAAPQLVAQKGTQAPGTPPGVVYNLPSVRLNEAGQVSLYESRLFGPGIITPNTLNFTAVFIGTPGAMQLAARDGDPSPGNTSTYGGFGGTMLVSTFNDRGQVIFHDSWTGPDVNSDNENAIFGGSVGSMQLVARGGNQAPGAPAGVNYRELDLIPGINDSGQVAFYASWTTGVGGVDNTNNHVLYAGPMAFARPDRPRGKPSAGHAPGTTYFTFPAASATSTRSTTRAEFSSPTFSPAPASPQPMIMHFAGPWNAPQLIVREGDPAPDTAARCHLCKPPVRRTVDEFGYLIIPSTTRDRSPR